MSLISALNVFQQSSNNSVEGTLVDITRSSVGSSSLPSLEIQRKSKERVFVVVSQEQANYILVQKLQNSQLAQSNVDADSPISSTDRARISKSQISISVTCKPTTGKKWFATDLNATPSSIIRFPEGGISKEKQKTPTAAATEWPKDEEVPRFRPVPSTRVPGSQFTRIGYAIFDTPIEHLHEQKQSFIEQNPVLRENGTIKRFSGFSNQTYNISYTATTTDDVKKSVQEVLEQVLLNPIVYCEGGPFGETVGEGDIPYHEFIVQNINLSTVPNMPSAISVDITMSPFLFSWYCPQTENTFAEDKLQLTLDDITCWPLVETWCKTRGRSVFNENSGRPLNGKFVLSLPKQTLINEIEKKATETNNFSTAKDFNTFSNLREILTNNTLATDAGSNIKTTNLKRINSSKLNPGESVYLIKVSSREAFNALTKLKGYLGLADWSIYKDHNFIDDNGKYLPDSGNIDAGSLVGGANGILGFSTSLSEDKDFSFLAFTKKSGSLKTNITSYFTELIRVTSSATNKTTQQDLQNALDTPWDSFAIAISVSKDTFLETKTTINQLLRGEGLKRKVTFNPERDAYLSTIRNSSNSNEIYVSAGFSDDDDFIVESIGATRETNAVPISIEGLTLPIHQVLGGGKTQFIVKGKCFSLTAKRRLEEMKNEFDKRSINVSNSPFGGGTETTYDSIPFIQVTNEIFQLMGVDFVMPIVLTMESIPEQPHVWDYEIVFVEYDPKAQAAEKIKFLSTTLQSEGRVLDFQNDTISSGYKRDPLVEKAVEYFSLNYSLASEELYTDMKLPTKNELDTWISLLGGEAKRRLSHRKQDSTLFDFEKSLIDISEKYLRNPYCLKKIAEFDDKDTHANAEVDGGTWADPDFYLAYDPNSLWGALFDKASELEYGTRNDSLEAEAVKNINKAVFYREYDPLFNTTTVYDKDYLSTGVKDLENEINAAITSRTFPEENRDRAIAVTKKAGSTLDSYNGAWWQIRTSREDSKGGVNIDDPAMYDAVNTSTFISAVNTEIAPEDIEKDLKDAPTILRKEFLNFGWRAKQLKLAGSFGRSNTKAHYDLVAQFKDGNHKSFLIPYTQQLNTRLPDDYQLYADYFSKIENGDIDAPYGWDPIIDVVKKNTFSGGDNSFKSGYKEIFEKINTNSKVLALYILNASVGYSTFQKVAIQSANYSSQKNIDSSKKIGFSVVTGNPTENLLSNAELFDSIAAENNVDPNILRAFALRRSGGGDNSITPESGDTGSLHLSIAVVGPGSDLGTSLPLVAKTYAKYLKKYSDLPILALSATHIELTTQGRGKFWGGQDKFTPEGEAAFKKANNALSDRYGKQAANAVRGFLKELGPEVANIIDDYWTGYIEVSRVMGSHIHPDTEKQRDLFFNPFNSFILYDTSKDVEGATTSITPSGTRNRIALTRSTMYRLSAGARLANLDNINETQAAAIRIKVDFGLEPHSENAIYGTTIDVRKHGKWGRLLQAYPSYKVLLINEGFYYANGNVKIWDQFYSRGGISSIEVFKSKSDPAHIATVEFSNMFTAITRYAQVEALRQKAAERANNRGQDTLTTGKNLGAFASRVWANIFSKYPDKEFLRIWQNNHLNTVSISPGARIQIRMGFGSNAAKLPVVFNGKIIEVPLDRGSVAVQAVGDGWELQKPLVNHLEKATDGGAAYQSPNGILGTGTEPSYIIAQTMVPNDVTNNFIPALTGGRFLKKQFAPHFGDLLFDGDSYHAPELSMNMYGSSKGAMEQQFSWFNQILSKNAIFNWDQDKTLISVSVKEPTTWKTANVCRMAVMDFVTSVEPFHTQSTLFFGRWWYPFNYAYDPSILKYSRPTPNPGTSTIIPDETQLSNNQYNSKPLQVRLEANKDDYDKLSPVLKTWIKLKGITDDIISVNEDSIPPPYAGIEYTKAYLIIFAPKESKAYGAVLKYSSKTLPSTIETNLEAVSMTTISIEQAQKLRGNGNEFFIGLIKKPSDIKGIDDPSIIREVSNYVQHLKWKSYVQVYPATTGLNLITNSLSLDSSKVFTEAVGQHIFNGITSSDTISKTMTFSVDSDIQDAERRTMLVDTGLYVTAAQKGWWESIRDGIGQWVPVVGDSIKGVPDTPAIENSVLTGLCDSVKTMYSGVFTVVGMASIKPHDLILLDDLINVLQGPCFVRNVTHVMNYQQGFVSMISPDCIALPHTSIQGEKLVTALAMGPISKISQYVVGRGIQTLAIASLKRRLTAPFKMRIREVTEGIDAIKDSDLTSTIIKDGIDELRPTMLDLVDAKLANANSFNPFANSKQRKELLALKKILQDKTNNNLYEIFRRATELNIDIPAFKANPAIGKINNLLQEAQIHQANVYKTLSQDVSFASESPNILKKAADKAATDFLEAELYKQYGFFEKSLNHQKNRLNELNAALGQKLKAIGDSDLEELAKIKQIEEEIANVSNKVLKLETTILSHDEGLNKINGLLGDIRGLNANIPLGELEKIEQIVREGVEAKKISKVASGSVRLVGHLTKVANKIEEAGSTVAATRLAKQVSNVVSVGSMLGPQVVLRAAVEVVRLSIGASIINWFNASLGARQSVRIIPLRTTDSNGIMIPYLAGLRGHQGAVIGDDPSYFDKFIGNWLGGQSSDVGPTLTSILSGVLGVTVPDYGNTEQDSIYLEEIRKLNAKRVDER